MSSDRVRVSYDPTRQYRSVIAQQGRVTLEADWNEAQVIAGEELRRETLDIVGPSGTPDDGYRVLTGTVEGDPSDFQVQQGTMYVGGERVFLPEPTLQYSQQDEWLDHTDDPLWVDPEEVRDRRLQRELIYLLLREQEVSAVEDPALKDEALGGPDSAQRTRLIQRIVRLETEAQDCRGALEAAREAWEPEGLALDPETMRLVSTGRLKVDFADTDTDPDLCEPEARGGYLGADNQLIRIQVSGIEEDGRPRIAWGFDNASFLYRVAVDPPGGQSLRLLSRPVDDYHMPRANQAVEVLRSAARLTDDDYIASANGTVFTLARAYDPGTQTISLPAPLATEYLDSNETPLLFLRVWESEEVITPGQPIELRTDKQSTGLRVTLQAPGATFHVGDYWQIAVRPSTSTEVYPRRYLEEFQPPEGPRLWICPLAVVELNRENLEVLKDCRNPLDNLTELTRRGTGCCEVRVRQEDVHEGLTLQDIIDALPEGVPAKVCMMPGEYELPEPLVLGPERSHLTIEACDDGAVLRAAPGRERAFPRGLVVLNRAEGVTFRGLQFRLPDPPAGTTLRRGGNFAAELRPLGLADQAWSRSIGIFAFHCAELTVENCLFRYSLARRVNLWAAGIFATSECRTHTICGNRFLHDAPAVAPERDEPHSILVGYQLASSMQLTGQEDRRTGRVSTGTIVPSLLEDATFRDNKFTNLAVAVLIQAGAGGVTIEDNVVHGCYAGFLLVLPSSPERPARVLNRVMVAEEAADVAGQIRDAMFAPMLNPILLRASVLAHLVPLDEAFDTQDAIELRFSVGAEEQAGHLQELFDRLLPRINSSFRREAGDSEVPLDEAGGMEPSRLNAILEGEQGTFHDTYMRMVALEREALAAMEERGKAQLVLRVANNEIDSLLPENAPEDEDELFGLLVQCGEGAPESLVTVTANTVRTRRNQEAAPVALLLPWRCSVTGNVLLNEADSSERFSLLIAPGRIGIDPRDSEQNTATVAITGNVCEGRLLAPDRNWPEPLDTWDVLNTVFL